MPWTSDFLRARPANIIAAGVQAFALAYTVYKLATAAHQLYTSYPSRASSSLSTLESSNGYISTRDHESDSAGLTGSGETSAANGTDGDTTNPQLHPAVCATGVKSVSHTARNSYTFGGQVDAASDEETVGTGRDDQQSDLSEGSGSEQGVENDEGTNSELGSEVDPLEAFQPVIDAIDFEALAATALETRRTQMAFSETSNLVQLETAQALSCMIRPQPLSGSYNIVYIILFSDGVKWIARIPGKALTFEDLDIQAMNCDYQTLRYIKQNTFLPVPDVLHWETTSDRIGTPYALMSFIDGTQICDRWFDKSWITDQKRLKILNGIASYLSQLHKLSFEEIGALQFYEEKTQPEVIGSVWLESQKDNAWGKGHLSGPYKSLKSYLIADWDEVDDCAMRARSAMDIISLAVNSIPDFMTCQSQFSLAPLDCNWQNIFIDDDANVVGFIDWDGVHARPSCLGFARYPSWITRDWDPAKYNWDPEDEDQEESSPAELSRYRRHYADIFESYTLPNYDPRETRLSHLVEAIDIALRTRPCRGPIIRKLLDHAFHGESPFAIKDYADAYVEGKTGKMNEQIRTAFKHMWHAEWEHSEETNLERWRRRTIQIGRMARENGQEDDRTRARGKRRNEAGDNVLLRNKVRSS